MEVGSLRERILVALMLYKFGEENVNSEIPITESEVDVIVYDTPISIKTKSGTSLSGVKLIWTVDYESSMKFKDNYKPSCDMIFIQINWSKEGGFYYIPKEVQLEILRQMGKDEYIKMPKAGTNPRGAEISSSALKLMIENNKTYSIPIIWKKDNIQYNSFGRWVEQWQQD